MTRVINFYGGPSAGKSTNAAQLFGWMKAQRYNVEYVTEYAKQLTWDQRASTLDDQLYVFAKQHHRFYQLRDQVDWIITDSPLLLSLHYLGLGMKKFNFPHYTWRESFASLVLETVELYSNYHYFVDRQGRKFIQAGRNQNEAESVQIDIALSELLGRYVGNFRTIRSFEEVIKDLDLGEQGERTDSTS